MKSLKNDDVISSKVSPWKSKTYVEILAFESYRLPVVCCSRVIHHHFEYKLSGKSSVLNFKENLV